MQAEDLSSKHADTLRLKETIIKNLELELQQYRDHAAAQDHAIEHLERERRKCAAEVSDATAKYMKVQSRPCQVEQKGLGFISVTKSIKLRSGLPKFQKLNYKYHTCIRTTMDLIVDVLVVECDECICSTSFGSALQKSSQVQN